MLEIMAFEMHSSIVLLSNYALKSWIPSNKNGQKVKIVIDKTGKSKVLLKGSSLVSNNIDLNLALYAS